MPANTYLGIGYGKNHHSVDMVAWVATSDKVTVTDLYSYNNYKPPTDAQQDYNITGYQPSIRQANSTVKRWNFTCIRLFDTGDVDYDYTIKIVSFLVLVYGFFRILQYR